MSEHLPSQFCKKINIHCCLRHLKLIKLVQEEHRFVCFPHIMVNIGTPCEVITNNGPQEFEGLNVLNGLVLDDRRVKRLKFVFSCGIPLPLHWFWGMLRLNFYLHTNKLERILVFCVLVNHYRKSGQTQWYRQQI